MERIQQQNAKEKVNGDETPMERRCMQRKWELFLSPTVDET